MLLLIVFRRRCQDYINRFHVNISSKNNFFGEVKFLFLFQYSVKTFPFFVVMFWWHCQEAFYLTIEKFLEEKISKMFFLSLSELERKMSASYCTFFDEVVKTVF